MLPTKGFALLAVIVLLVLSSGQLAFSFGEPIEEAEFKKIAKSCDIHGVGIAAPRISEFGTDQISDWTALARSLKSTDPAAKHIRGAMSMESQALLASLSDSDIETLGSNKQNRIATVRRLLASELNKVIKTGDSLFDREALNGVRLNAVAKGHLAKKTPLTRWEKSSLNWEILASSFTDAIIEPPADYFSASVTVGSTDDMILVLSSTSQCRWVITVKPGHALRGIVLCGTESIDYSFNQDGVDVPILYRAYHARTGEERIVDPSQYFHGYSERQESWKKFQSSIKALCGRGFTSFQGVRSPKAGVGFVVPQKP